MKALKATFNGKVSRNLKKSMEQCMKEQAVIDARDRSSYDRGAANPYDVMIVVGEWWDCVATCHHKSHADMIADFFLSKGHKVRVDGCVKGKILGEVKTPKNYKNS